MNMVRQRRILLISVKCGVMPVERPTVPNPDTTSKKICINVRCGSVMQIARVMKHTRIAAKKVTVNAFRMLSEGILRLKAAHS